MGGRGNTGSRSTGNNTVLKAAQDYVSNHLSSGEQFAKATNAKIVGEVDETGMADVKVEYETRVRVAVGYDPELQRMEYEDDTEYHTDTFRMKVGEGNSRNLSNRTAEQLDALYESAAASKDRELMKDVLAELARRPQEESQQSYAYTSKNTRRRGTRGRR